MGQRVWPNKCSTCSGKYKKPLKPDDLCFCSNAFHCCRDCVWYDGRRIVVCEECQELEKLIAKEWEEQHDKE